MKLSARQIEVVKLMRDGWEMGWSSSIDAHIWIQKGGVGRGGETKSVNANTALALYNKKLIESTGYRFPTSTYKLTKLGREIKLLPLVIQKEISK